MDVRDRETGFRYLFSAEVAVRPHTVDDTITMELRSARLYLSRATELVHVVECYRAGEGPMMRTVLDEDLPGLGADEPLCAPRSPDWVGLVSVGHPLAFVSAKIRAAQEAHDNGLWWADGDDEPARPDYEPDAADF